MANAVGASEAVTLRPRATGVNVRPLNFFSGDSGSDEVNVRDEAPSQTRTDLAPGLPLQPQASGLRWGWGGRGRQPQQAEVCLRAGPRRPFWPNLLPSLSCSRDCVWHEELCRTDFLSRRDRRLMADRNLEGT